MNRKKVIEFVNKIWLILYIRSTRFGRHRRHFLGSSVWCHQWRVGRVTVIEPARATKIRTRFLYTSVARTLAVVPCVVTLALSVDFRCSSFFFFSKGCCCVHSIFVVFAADRNVTLCSYIRAICFCLFLKATTIHNAMGYNVREHFRLEILIFTFHY